MEIWKPIKGYENKYAISNLGRVKRLAHTVEMKLKNYPQTAHYKERILKIGAKGPYGYAVVDLGGHNQQNVHRLVAEAFCENPNNYNIVDHKNGNPRDNRANNLRWVSNSENLRAELLTKNKERNPYKVMCVEANMIFENSQKAAKWILKNNLTIQTKNVGHIAGRIRNCCNGRITTAYTFHWKRL